MHVLNLKFMRNPTEIRECSKTIHMSSMSEQKDLPLPQIAACHPDKAAMFAMQCNAGAVYLLLVANDSIDCSVKVVQTSVCSFWFSSSVCRAHIIPCDKHL